MSKTVEIIDQQSHIRSAVGGSDQKGIIWLLEEEALYPNSSAETFTGKVLTMYGIGKEPYVLPSDTRSAFKIRHQSGQFEAEYETSNWLRQSREASAQFIGLSELLMESKKGSGFFTLFRYFLSWIFLFQRQFF
jgi:myosin-18